jgi:hypothetical protein
VTVTSSVTAPVPSYELQLGEIRRREPLPLALLEALDTKHGRAQNAAFLERFEYQRTAGVKDGFYQKALDFAHELVSKKKNFLDRARVRCAVADYLGGVVHPYALRHESPDVAAEVSQLACKLYDARPIGIYGLDWLEEAGHVQWSNRAGLVKLCPDDAREESQRSSRLYGERIAMLDEAGYVLRSAVFTLPNFPRWHLAAGIDSIYEQFKRTILYARTDGRVARSIRDPKRKFPDLVGAWACLEAPLSARHETDPSNAWNVHLNVLLVFKPSQLAHGMPDYGPIREAWGSIIHWHTIPQGDRDAQRAALRELVKYPLQTVGEKSGRKHADGSSAAPPLICWPPDCFLEWWRAHKGFRRTRSWGMLYAGHLAERYSPDLDRIGWCGSIRLTPSRCVVTLPKPDTREADRAARIAELEFRYRQSRGLEMLDSERAAVLAERRRVRDSLQWAELWADDLTPRGGAGFTLIQGNKSAGPDAAEGVGRASSAQKSRGPPD